MKMKKIIFLFILVFLVSAGSAYLIFANTYYLPDVVIGHLEVAIAKAETTGFYNCCMEPACTVCYLGQWKFEKGTCYCGEAIADGRYEDVCPACADCVGSPEQSLCAAHDQEEDEK